MRFLWTFRCIRHIWMCCVVLCQLVVDPSLQSWLTKNVQTDNMAANPDPNQKKLGLGNCHQLTTTVLHFVQWEPELYYRYRSCSVGVWIAVLASMIRRQRRHGLECHRLSFALCFVEIEDEVHLIILLTKSRRSSGDKESHNRARRRLRPPQKDDSHSHLMIYLNKKIVGAEFRELRSARIL